jgi:hypothetical protein
MTQLNVFIYETMRCLLHQGHLPNSLWLKAIKIACYLLNHHIKKSFKNLTPQQEFSGRKQDVFHLHTFGIWVHVHILSHQCSKMDPKASKCILLGGNKSTKGYHCYCPSTWKIIIFRNIKIDEFKIPLLDITIIKSSSNFNLQYWTIKSTLIIEITTHQITYNPSLANNAQKKSLISPSFTPLKNVFQIKSSYLVHFEISSVHVFSLKHKQIIQLNHQGCSPIKSNDLHFKMEWKMDHVVQHDFNILLYY